MMLEKVRRMIDEYGMLGKGDKVVVAVSGGPDSIALLSILFALREEYGISLHVAHLNHMFRGKEAERDALYVKKLARKLGLPVTAGKRNVPALIRRRKLSPEEGARQARYGFLLKVAREVKANKIAVGSTADDQAETVLMKMLRGSGLKGLTGISPLRSLENLEFSPLSEENIPNFKPSTLNLKLYIIRPLLEVNREEIEDYLKRAGLRPCRDSSNRNLIYLRNRIRQELLPRLTKDYNPHIKSILSGMARVLQADEEYLAGQAEGSFSDVAKKKKQQIVIDVDKLKRLHLSMQRRILRKGIESVKGDLRGVSLTQLDDILRIVNGPGGLEIHLPQDIVVRRSYGDLAIFKKRRGERQKSGYRIAAGGICLEVPGETAIKELNLRVRCSLLPRGKVQLPEKGSFSKGGTAYFDFHKIKLPILVRQRRRGDSFQPLGMKGRKKLKDFFMDRKIPREEREEIPLLIQGEDILWVIGHRQGEKAKVTDKTKKVLLIRIEKINHKIS